jgi:hypothetical protein
MQSTANSSDEHSRTVRASRADSAARSASAGKQPKASARMQRVEKANEPAPAAGALEQFCLSAFPSAFQYSHQRNTLPSFFSSALTL